MKCKGCKKEIDYQLSLRMKLRYPKVHEGIHDMEFSLGPEFVKGRDDTQCLECFLHFANDWLHSLRRELEKREVK